MQPSVPSAVHSQRLHLSVPFDPLHGGQGFFPTTGRFLGPGWARLWNCDGHAYISSSPQPPAGWRERLGSVFLEPGGCSADMTAWELLPEGGRLACLAQLGSGLLQAGHELHDFPRLGSTHKRKLILRKGVPMPGSGTAPAPQEAGGAQRGQRQAALVHLFLLWPCLPRNLHSAHFYNILSIPKQFHAV